MGDSKCMDSIVSSRRFTNNSKRQNFSKLYKLMKIWRSSLNILTSEKVKAYPHANDVYTCILNLKNGISLGL